MDKPPISLNLAFLIITIISLFLSAFFIYQNWRLNQKLNVLIQSQPTLSPTPFTDPQAKPDLAPPDTSSWKTYTNEPIGLSFKYPPTLSLKISDKGLYFVDVTGLFQTNISWNKSTSPLEEEIKGRDLCPKEVTNGIVVGPIANSLRCDFIKSHYASVDIWIMNGNNLYKATIGAINPNTPIPVESITLLDQILSTFKFVDVTGKSCQSDADCGSGYTCMVVTGTQQMDRNGKPVDIPKTCYPKDAPLPQ